MRPLIALLGMFVSIYAYADASDYIWVQQFNEKLELAQQGDVRAQYDLGNMYLKGKGVNIDEQKAFEWLEKAAKKGYSKAEYKLGYLFLKGKGTSRNHAKAAKWLQRAARQGYSPAQFYLGKMYADGMYFKRDYRQALAWLGKAAKQGYWRADDEVQRVRKASRRAERSASQKSTSREKEKRSASDSARRVENPKSLLLAGTWLDEDQPALYLPSSVTDCNDDGSTISCVSNAMESRRGATTFRYRYETSINGFEQGGRFRATYRGNVLDVAQDKGKDKDAKVVPIKAGLQRTAHVLECEFQNKNTIACTKDNIHEQEFLRAP